MPLAGRTRYQHVSCEPAMMGDTAGSGGDLTFPSTYAAFADQVRRTPEALAVSDDGAALTYEELLRASRHVGAILLARGFEKGDRVAIWANNRLEWIVAALGLQAAGLVLVPLGTRLRGGEIADILARSGAKGLFADAGFGSYRFIDALAPFKLPDLRMIVCFDPQSQGAEDWDAFRRTEPASDAALDARLNSISDGDLVDILFTSGTTGLPKGVPLTHGQSLIACRQYQQEVCRFTPGETFCVIFPFAHSAGYRAGWQLSLLNGVRVVPVRDTQADALLRLIGTERPSYMPAAPPVFQAILDCPDRRLYDLSCIRIASTGGTDVPVQLVHRMRAELGVAAVITGYGMTEAAGSVTNSHPDDSDDIVARTAGRPLSNLDVICVDAALREVPRSEQGEILVRGPQVFRGYFEDPAASRSAFTPDGFFRTGDIGMFDADGNLAITGRLKDMYIVGGFNCYPAEIERSLRKIDGVADVSVIGVADARLGEVGHAFIVPLSGRQIDEASVIAWCRANMANYKVPRAVTFLAELPRNAQGKVLKAALRADNG